MQLAMDLEIDNIIVEGDSQQLIQLIQRHMEDHQSVGVIVADILRHLAGFSGADTVFVKWSDNSMAHNVSQRVVRGLVSST